jgi:parvulin-like peptidyl-prolyl isomerase
MGTFKKGVYPEIEPILERTKVGDSTGVVETPNGYEILLRSR